MSTLSDIGNTAIANIQSVGYFWFAIMLVIDIILYKIHPVLGLLGTLFLFGWLTGLIH